MRLKSKAAGSRGVLILIAVLNAAVVESADAQRPAVSPLQLTLDAANPDAGITATLRNASVKDVTAWVVRQYVAGNLVSSTGAEGSRLAPQQQISILLPYAQTGGDRTYRVGAIFADRTAAGDESGIQELFDRRAAKRDELAQWVNRIRRLREPGVDVAAFRKELEVVVKDEASSGGAKSVAMDLQYVFKFSEDNETQRAARLRTLLDRKVAELSAATTAAVRKIDARSSRTSSTRDGR